MLGFDSPFPSLLAFKQFLFIQIPEFSHEKILRPCFVSRRDSHLFLPPMKHSAEKPGNGCPFRDYAQPERRVPR